MNLVGKGRLGRTLLKGGTRGLLHALSRLGDRHTVGLLLVIGRAGRVPAGTLLQGRLGDRHTVGLLLRIGRAGGVPAGTLLQGIRDRLCICGSLVRGLTIGPLI